MEKALLIVDVQNDYFEGGKSELYKPQEALANIVEVLKLFRDRKLPVIHVQHINISDDASFFLPNTDGVLIHKSLTPLDNETLIIKHAPNSFLNTNLVSVLRKNKITELIICGMMSHMCIDTTVRACMDHGIKATVIADACTTKNLVFNEETISASTVHDVFMASLNGVFAKVIKTSELRIETR